MQCNNAVTRDHYGGAETPPVVFEDQITPVGGNAAVKFDTNLYIVILYMFHMTLTLHSPLFAALCSLSDSEEPTNVTMEPV